MIFKSQVVSYSVLIVIGLLLFAVFRGCKKSKEDAASIKKLKELTNEFEFVSKRALAGWERSEEEYADSLEFERGQRLLAEAQKERLENDLIEAVAENARLIDRYKRNEYDTSSVLSPKDFVRDCHDCFRRLEMTDRITLNYKKEVDNWSKKYKSETSLLGNRIFELGIEKMVYHRQVDSLKDLQKNEVDKIDPFKGRLYLSWGVMWGPWPKMAGAGLMYQNKQNIIWGAKWYYGERSSGSNGHMVETTINFPLSLKFKFK